MKYIRIESVLIATIFILSLSQETFLTTKNLLNILDSNAAIFIIAVGITFNMLTGGVDLSVGSTAALSGLLLSELLRIGTPQLLSIALVLFFGLSLGLAVNGFLIGKLRLSFFVVTLGTMAAYRGALLVYTQARTSYLYNWPLITSIGSGSFLGVRTPTFLMLIVFLIGFFILGFTNYGKSIYAVGGNEEAANLAGLNTNRVLVSVYGVSGLLAALGGIIRSGRFAIVSPAAFTGVELEVAAAVLLGGTSFFGGTGGVSGTLIGVLFIGVLKNGLSLMGVSSDLQGIFTGVVLILAVVVDTLHWKSP